jgi:hypothetical protein
VSVSLIVCGILSEFCIEICRRKSGVELEAGMLEGIFGNSEE